MPWKEATPMEQRKAFLEAYQQSIGMEQTETKGVYNVNYCGSIIRRVELNEG